MLKLTEEKARLLHLAVGALMPSLGFEDRLLASQIQTDLAIEIARESDRENT